MGPAISDEADRNRDVYDFRAPIDPGLAPAADPLLRRITQTRAFQRLRAVRFLGGIDYLRVPVPNGRLGHRRYTRYQHSLGVTRLALRYCGLKSIEGAERRLIALAALLHDIGHAPLSHSLEPVFRRHFGIDHHVATAAIVTGHAPIGRDVHELLRDADVDIDRLVGLMGGHDAGHDGFFAGPINFDTIEGILRTQTYERPAPRAANPETVMLAATRRSGLDDRIVVDEFWLYKDMVYRFIINAESGVLADAACQAFMSRHLDRFSGLDFYETEAALFRKLPGLRPLLTSPAFQSEVRTAIGATVAFKARRFTVDPAGDFFARQDKARYRQSKTDRSVDLGPAAAGSGHDLAGDLFDDDSRH